jgi:hypothetical protein
MDTSDCFLSEKVFYYRIFTGSLHAFLLHKDSLRKLFKKDYPRQTPLKFAMCYVEECIFCLHIYAFQSF